MPKNKWLVGCLAVIAALIVLVVIIALIALVTTRPVTKVSHDFLKALAAEDYGGAYDTFSSQLQSELGGVEALEDGIKSNSMTPADWNLNSRSVENGVGSVEGNVDFADGRTGTVRLRLTREDGKWMIAAFSLEPDS